MSWDPDEQCYLCGHTHKTMGHFSRGTETRALCHEDDHSCYSEHNRSETLRLDNIDRARAEGDQAYAEFLSRRPKYGTVYVHVLPDISKFTEAINRMGREATKALRQLNALGKVPRKQLLHKGRKP